MDNNPKLLKSKLFWIGILYFAEGFPLGVFYDVFPVHLRQQGVDLSSIGFLSLLGLAWTLKFIWAPAVDVYRQHRRWIFMMDLLMGMVLLVFAWLLEFGPWTWVAVGLFTLFSATSDIAIDAYTIEMLKKNELGIANGFRNGFYRVGMLAAGFILILSDWISWSATYIAGALLIGTCGVVCLFAPAEREVIQEKRTSLKQEMWQLVQHPWGLTLAYLLFLAAVKLADNRLKFSDTLPYLWPYLLLMIGVVYFSGRIASAARNRKGSDSTFNLSEGPMFGAMFELLQRPFIIPVILFILTYKLADTSMGFMVKPFWVDKGFTATEIGLVSVNIGLGLSIAGGLVGGWFTDRFGIIKGIWVLGILQALSNLGYAGVASVLPDIQGGGVIESGHRWLMYSASIVESFTGGLGSAAFLAFMMAIVNKNRSAAEYALLSSLFAFSRSVAGWASGFGAESMGYSSYFLLTFFLAFPAYLLLPWVKQMLHHTKDWE